jgi:group II intron reverse transcriptase/maturase
MIKKDQTLCVIFIVGDSREDVLDRRKPLNPEQGWAVVTDTGAFREASLAVRSRVLPAISEDDINAHPGELWERVFSRANLMSALKRVEHNRGAPGVDGLTVAELRDWLSEHWDATRVALDAGVYRPLPVAQVMIPKPDGGQRRLGIPSVVDRLVQQAIAQVLVPVFDPGFVPVSYGFRPHRSAHDAVLVAKQAIQDGYRWVVEVDLDAFFDRVNHDMLMARIARKVEDTRLLRLIRAYLQAGIMTDGVVQATSQGTPQGSPLSPLLSNILLDDFDQLFWSRGHRFVRYADDIRVMVRSKRAAYRVLEVATRFFEDRLRLKVNRTKSSVKPASSAELLGYAFYFAKGSQVKLRMAPATRQRVKERLRALTSRRWSVSMEERLRRLNQYIRGWMGYFRLLDTPKILKTLDKWFHRRLRQIRWKEWKRPKTRIRMLRSLGIRPELAYQWGNASRAYWRIAKSPILHRALPRHYWHDHGVIFFYDAWLRFRPNG